MSGQSAADRDRLPRPITEASGVVWLGSLSGLDSVELRFVPDRAMAMCEAASDGTGVYAEACIRWDARLTAKSPIDDDHRGAGVGRSGPFLSWQWEIS